VEEWAVPDVGAEEQCFAALYISVPHPSEVTNFAVSCSDEKWCPVPDYYITEECVTDLCIDHECSGIF